MGLIVVMYLTSTIQQFSRGLSVICILLSLFVHGASIRGPACIRDSSIADKWRKQSHNICERQSSGHKIFGNIGDSRATVIKSTTKELASSIVPDKNENRITLDWRLPLSGGLAGSLATAILYPIDTLKTIRQSDKSLRSFQSALTSLSSSSNGGLLKKVYSGFLPAVCGSFPSSALYFGAYESSKMFLYSKFADNELNNNIKIQKPFLHMIAAASGNILSSFIFVPKEAIKQQMQALRVGAITIKNTNGVGILHDPSLSDLILNIFQSRGIKGFFPSYSATLLRNIPSAIFRFTIYEEFKRLYENKSFNDGNDSTQKIQLFDTLAILVVGGFASALSSTLTTPLDVVKTRIATGIISRDTNIIKALIMIGKTEGIAGLYSGYLERALWSGLFGGIGFTSFETIKICLGVEKNGTKRGINTKVEKLPRKQTR